MITTYEIDLRTDVTTNDDNADAHGGCVVTRENIIQSMFKRYVIILNYTRLNTTI